LSLLLVAVCLACFVSCKKDEKPKDDEPKEPITQQEAIEALTEFAQVGSQFDATIGESGDRVNEGLDPSGSPTRGGYPIVTCEAQGEGLWLVTCDYGPTLIECPDGYLRRGIVNIVTSGLFTTPGTVMTLTFDNYYQQDNGSKQEYKIDGTQKIINEGANSGNPEMTDYTVTVTDGIITYNSKEVHYSETTTRTLLPNEELCENNWYITGEWNGVSSGDVPYTLKANSTPLHYIVCCHFFQDGILDIDIEGLPPITIDYGYFEGEEPDECDRKALLSCMGHEFVINM